MIKSLISVLVASLIILFGAIYENWFIKVNFEDFNTAVTSVYQKVNDKTALEDDVYALQQNWFEKKKKLHVFIPHTEIKEVDLWLSEAVKLVREKKWEDALSKIEVLKVLSSQIPKTFSVAIQNIM